MSAGRSLPACTSDLGPQVARGLGQKAGPLTGSLTAGRWLCSPRHGHELTVMEFEKPKPDLVEKSVFNFWPASGIRSQVCWRGGGCRLYSRLGAQLSSTA